jgi:hypothetical protein
MKKNVTGLLALLMLVLGAYAADPVDEAVLKIFNESFKEAKEVSWSQTKEHYIVDFVKDDIRYHVTYDRKGKFINSRRYYFQEKLPMYVLFKVKNRFKGKSIYGVTEVMDEFGVEYYITLEDSKDWWMVKVTSRDFMEVTQKLMKSETK